MKQSWNAEKPKGRKRVKSRGDRSRNRPTGGVRDKDQINLTDEESRIMPVSGGGFEQAYNAQAVVDNETLLIVSNHVSQKTNDKKELTPALEALKALPESLGRPQEFLADNGYFSESNVESCVNGENDSLHCGGARKSLCGTPGTFGKPGSTRPRCP